MRDKTEHALLWWGAQHVCSQVQQVWTGFGVQYCNCFVASGRDSGFSLDLAPSDFWMFPTLKMGLKGTCFANMEYIKSNVTAELWKIPKETFHWCFQQWQD
jgi:hypothetical protein